MDKKEILKYIASVRKEYGDARLLRNYDYRHTLLTVPEHQIVLYTLRPREDIPSEVHKDGVQVLFVLRGKMYSHIGDVVKFTEAEDSVIVRANTRHYIANGSTDENLHIISYYSPPVWPVDYVEKRQGSAK